MRKSKNAKAPATGNAESTTPRDVNAAQRATMAMELRAQKLSYEEIAKRCGYGSRGACFKAVQRELDRCVVQNVNLLRTEELAMLDRLHSECWQLAIDKDNSGRLWAVDRVLAIAERRAKLMGLDQTPDAANNLNVVVVRETPPNYLNPPQQEGQLL